MTRSPSSSLIALAGALTLSACAFADGDPWGRLELAAAARFDAPADRVVDGAVKTARNYLVTLDAVDLVVGAITVSQRAEGAAAAFDPADPPEGYSLCHNGHCHAADGRLVPYEEIAAELAGGGASAGPSVTVVALDAPVAVPVASGSLGAAAAVALGACPGGCVFERGALDTVRVTVSALRLRGTVHDQLVGDAARLPAEGRAFDVTLTPTDALTASLSGAFDKGEPVGLRLEVTLALPAALFDGVDWSAAADAELPGLTAAAFGEHAAIEVVAARFE
ncbi:MAG: hypothetical protein CVU56_06090 [Deltaproteobacteria bacterium HGW-Deltaproteobacteria-14]|jgi:hypothetical protein|nr:MAG: hypothetical protein CVU56_06090 [Deltaproteobacteria bacterium HGW-Deltaproteobacteria-14]